MRLDQFMLVENDWVETDPSLRKRLVKMGFKPVKDGGYIIAWYHPKHWKVGHMMDAPKNFREDTYLFEWGFMALTKQAKDSLKEE